MGIIIYNAIINRDNKILKVSINNYKSPLNFAIEKGKIDLINLLLEDNDYLSLMKQLFVLLFQLIK